jgi:uncharacterized protein YbjT (DUF2867 family)
MLGKRLVPRLVGRGHSVRVLARHVVKTDGAEVIAGDVRTGDGLEQAVHEIDAVIHAATNPRRTARKTEVAGTANVLEAAEGSGAHLLYVSIVGVDRHRFPYYKAKWEAEQLVAASAARWTIQRATQFHDLLDLFLGYPVFIKTPHLAFQVVDAGEVAGRLADLVEAGPSERAPDFGGPEVLGIRELAASRQRITKKRSRLVRVPRLGPLRDFDDANHLCPDNRAGHITWEEWLSTWMSPTSRS